MIDSIGRFRLTGWRWLLALTPICVMALPLCARAYPVPTHSLPDMVSLSDVIAFGRVVDVREGSADQWGVVVWGRRPKVVDGVLTQVAVLGEIQPPLDVVMMEAQMEVEMAIKGAGEARDGGIAFRFPRLVPKEGVFEEWRFQKYQPGERWLIFLRRTDKGLEPLNPLGDQDLRIPDSMPLPEDLGGPGEQQLGEILLWLLTHGDEELQLRCLLWLDGPAADGIAEQTAQEMAFLLQSENDEIRLRAAKVLCRAKYAPAVRVLEREFQDAQVHYWLARGALQSLRYCPEEALAYVHSLLTFEEADPEVRRIAIEIIGVTADRGGVPSLIQALNDPEFELRYSAATFLAAWTRETTFTVTKEVFKSNESTYVKSLKQWWAEHGYQRVKDPESPMPVPPAPAGP